MCQETAGPGSEHVDNCGCPECNVCDCGCGETKPTQPMPSTISADKIDQAMVDPHECKDIDISNEHGTFYLRVRVIRNANSVRLVQPDMEVEACGAHYEEALALFRTAFDQQCARVNAELKRTGIDLTRKQAVMVSDSRRVSGYSAQAMLRQQRREKRLKEKGY